MKVQMLCRHTCSGKKLEPGMVYELPEIIARELVSHGLAVLFGLPPAPGFVPVKSSPARDNTGRFLPRGKKK